MHEASARVVAGTRDLCEAVWTGQTEHGVNFCGGLHHAMRGRGLRVLHLQRRRRRDPVAARPRRRARRLRRRGRPPRRRRRARSSGTTTAGAHRVDPRVGPGAVPGHRLAGDIGGPDAQGSATNVALPPGVADAGWLRAFHSTALPVVRAFRPQVLVTQHGCDTHLQDPLAHLALTVDAQREAADDAAPAQPRGMRRPLGRARRRRLRDRRRGAARVDAPHRDRRAPADPRDGARCPRTGGSTSQGAPSGSAPAPDRMGDLGLGRRRGRRAVVAIRGILGLTTPRTPVDRGASHGHAVRPSVPAIARELADV